MRSHWVALAASFVVLGFAPVVAAQSATEPPASRPPISTLESPPTLAGAPPKERLDYRIILTGYKDNYFISGFTKDVQVKFQFSLKFDLWPNHTNHSIYFGYTQKSLWNLYQSSSPFVDSNYNPELFYAYFKRAGDVVWAPGKVTFFLDSARAGLEHESNGRDGLDSRGWNRVYGFVDGGAYYGTDYYTTLALKGWLPPFVVDDYNKDIVSYLGYGEATFILGYDPESPAWWGGGHVGVNYYHGAVRDWSRQGIEAFVQWRPAYGDRVTWWRFTPFLYAQLFHGYGEYLLHYNQEETAFRVGISLEDRVHWLARLVH